MRELCANWFTTLVVVAATASAANAQPAGGPSQELDRSEIADIVKTYQTSIESLEVRTATRFFPVEKYAAQFPNAHGPETGFTVAFAFAPGNNAYRFTRTEREGRTVEARDEFKAAGVAYDVERAKLDLTRMVTVSIRNDYRGESAKVPPPEEILGGLYLVDGSPLHAFLSAADTRLVGRKTIDGASCYEIRGTALSRVQAPLQVVFFLDPGHDLLCREGQFVTDNGRMVKHWKTTEFVRVESRWFPVKVVRDVLKELDGKVVVTSHAHTEVEEVRINHRIEVQRFRPKITDGALVTDERGSEPKTYYKGGEEAGQRLQAYLDDLEKKAKSTALAATPATEPRIVVTAGLPWITLIASTIAVISGTTLVIAYWLRWRNG